MKTYEQYYSGLRNNIQHASVRHILTSTMSSLLANPARRAIQVEQAYFQRFWAEQDEASRNDIRMLVREGRLSFANGG